MTASVDLTARDRAAIAAEPTTVHVEVVLVATPASRTGPRIAAWFLDRVAAHDGVRADLLDLRERPPGDPRFASRIAAADAVVLVTPEYNHSFPGELKLAIDALRDEWRLTPVGIVSHGGVSGGLRATEALRLVLAELRAVVTRETVSFTTAQSRFDDDGQLLEPAAADVAAGRLLTELAWWARALPEAQRRDPFPL